MIEQSPYSMRESDIVSRFKSADGDDASISLGRACITLRMIVLNDYVTKIYIQDQDILSKCLEILKKTDLCSGRSRSYIMENAFKFSNSCRLKHLFNQRSYNARCFFPCLFKVCRNSLRITRFETRICMCFKVRVLRLPVGKLLKDRVRWSPLKHCWYPIVSTNTKKSRYAILSTRSSHLIYDYRWRKIRTDILYSCVTI